MQSFNYPAYVRRVERRLAPHMRRFERKFPNDIALEAAGHALQAWGAVAQMLVYLENIDSSADANALTRLIKLDYVSQFEYSAEAYPFLWGVMARIFRVGLRGIKRSEKATLARQIDTIMNNIDQIVTDEPVIPITVKHNELGRWGDYLNEINAANGWHAYMLSFAQILHDDLTQGW